MDLEATFSPPSALSLTVHVRSRLAPEHRKFLLLGFDRRRILLGPSIAKVAGPTIVPSFHRIVSTLALVTHLNSHSGCPRQHTFDITKKITKSARTIVLEYCGQSGC